MVAVGLAFVALVIFAGINTIRTTDSGTLGVAESGAGTALAEFAIPDARSGLTGDANIAQDDCESSTRPCPADERRTPACRVNEAGAIDVCDLFDKPLVISFWFTRGGDCEAQEDVFETAYRRYSPRINFLAVNVRDPRDTVRKLIDERGWTHPVGLDSDGALSNLYRIGGCPTFLYVYPGGILQDTSIGELDAAGLDARIDKLIAASKSRAET
jgi:thiol-disulfide isomerase/thioredoxin